MIDSPPPLSLYVHLPWCVRKCPYCDFNSHSRDDGIPETNYLDALLADLGNQSSAFIDRPIVSVFIGGGTPSLFSGAAIARVLNAIAKEYSLAPDVEITLEANPGAVDAGRFADYRHAGVSRLSIGMQSLRDPQLQRLGRIHDAAQAVDAFQAARDAGFDNINIDLMFGLPGDDLTGALSDIDEVIGLGPEHISWYQLTIEPNTAFYRHPPKLPSDDFVWELEQTGWERLAAAGYRQYEVSAYAKGGRQCRHNLNYWQFGDYLGIGAGAHSKLTDRKTQRIRRQVKQPLPSRYMLAAGTDTVISSVRDVADEERVLEFMMNSLRLTDGFPAGLFSSRTGLSLDYAATALAQARERGLLENSAARIQPTELGQRFLDDLLQIFFQHAEAVPDQVSWPGS